MSRSEVEFTKTPHCRREKHCGTCRDLEGGRAWRKDKKERYGAPEADWPCPKGHPWGYEGRSRGLGDTAAKFIKTVTLGLVKPCGGCKKRRAWLNGKFPYRMVI